MGRLLLLVNVFIIFRFKGSVDLKARQLIPMSLFWGVIFLKYDPLITSSSCPWDISSRTNPKYRGTVTFESCRSGFGMLSQFKLFWIFSKVILLFIIFSTNHFIWNVDSAMCLVYISSSGLLSFFFFNHAATLCYIVFERIALEI